jgi:hypothetical protein
MCAPCSYSYPLLSTESNSQMRVTIHRLPSAVLAAAATLHAGQLDACFALLAPPNVISTSHSHTVVYSSLATVSTVHLLDAAHESGSPEPGLQLTSASSLMMLYNRMADWWLSPTARRLSISQALLSGTATRGRFQGIQMQSFFGGECLCD